jgi:hypothetical protein
MGTQFKSGFDERRNYKGRPKGKPNKSVEDIREKLREFLRGQVPELGKIFKQLKDDRTRAGAREQLAIIERMIKHVLPPPPPENLLDGMSDQDLDTLIAYLQKRMNQ